MALADAIARIEQRFGTHALARGSATERHADDRRLLTGTSFDRLAGGLATARACAFVGDGTSGKLTLALRAVAAAQREGAFALWVDAPASLDPVAAERAGVALGRLLVVRTHTRDDALVACAAALRSDGFRAVVVDCGAPPRVALDVDALAPVLPLVRGSTSTFVVIAERGGARLALPTYHFARVAWEHQHGRTVGWTFGVSRAGSPERALFHVGALGRSFLDVGLRGELREAVG